MAETTSSPATQNSNSNQAEDQNPTPQSNQPDSVTPKEHAQPTQSTPPPLPPPPSIPMSVNTSPNPTLVSPPPPSVSYAPPPASYSPVMLPSVPSFRPFPQFTPFPNPAVPNPNFQNPSVQTSSFQPPGVTLVSSMAPVAVSGALGGSSTAATSVPPQPLMSYQVTAVGQPPNPALRPYAPMPNGYTPLPGLPRYAPPYPMMLRPGFPPRPPGAMGMMPTMARPSVPVIPGVRPIIPPVIRPVVPSVTPAEKPQTTVYVGKIAPSVENDFMLSLLQLCGPVKSWKRAQHPSNGTPRGFGFCEFESAEGVLRALRLLSKLNIDWQELVLNVNQATREYLERYVDKKVENSKKVKENEAATAVKESDAAEGVEKTDISNPSVVESKEDEDSGNKENDTTTFGIVTEEDKEADRQAREKLASMIAERLKTKPPPPPPPPPPAQVSDDVAGGSELLAKPKDGDSDADITRNANDAADEKIDDDTTSDTKQGSEHDRPETSSPDKSRRDRRSRDRDRDRERDLKREKEREIERYERETERERIRKEREQRRKIEEAERQYVECLKDWEYRERDKEKQRQYEKEKEKERESKRKKEIFYEEEDNDDDSRKRWRRSVLEDRRKKRLREREDDLADRQKEEEEIAEATRRAEEENKLQQQKLALKDSDEDIVNDSEKATVAVESSAEYIDKSVEQNYEGYPDHANHKGDGILQNGGSSDELNVAPVAAVDNQQSSNATTKKLGFGLVGSGKRTAVPSVFHEEDDEDVRKEKRMRPLVPIDYSTEELQAVQPIVSGAPQPNLAAAAEFAKRISSSSKEERSDSGKERNRRTSDRSSQRERERNDEDVNRPRDEKKEDHVTDREHGVDRLKTSENKKLLDAKQLIDMIPRTKEELFSYEINWAIYDKHGLHERMRPWISKKITEFLGEEETTLVDYIVSSTQEHLEAERMLQLLQSILDEEAEMFVLKMWRMLIFEIKKVETGLASKPKT